MHEQLSDDRKSEKSASLVGEGFSYREELAPKREQLIITSSQDPIRFPEVLGEKASKLLLLSQAGFNVPRFFIVVGNGTGELLVTDELREHFSKLSRPVIGRSAHMHEGRKHSFSGVFESIKGITELTQDRPDFEKMPAESVETAIEEFFAKPPTGLTEAYRQSVASAYDLEARRYLRQRDITDFDAQDMNLIVMEEKPLKILARFLTRDCHDRLLIHIHYEVRVDNREDGGGRNSGGVVTFNRSSGTILDKEIDESLRAVLTEFGEEASKIDDLLGMQQVELGFDGEQVYVFQSRTVNMADPSSIPRMTVSNRIPGQYTAHGFGFFSLPTIVIDRIENTGLDYQNDPEFKKLDNAARGKAVNDPEWEARAAYIEERRQLYRERLLALKAKFSDYALAIKDGEDIIWRRINCWDREKDYTFLNSLSRDAKVIIKGRHQNAIRHEDWDNVEVGGLKIIPNEHSEKGHLLDHFYFDGEGANFPWSTTVVSGDIVNYLSNVDGTFIWRHSRSDAC